MLLSTTVFPVAINPALSRSLAGAPQGLAAGVSVHFVHCSLEKNIFTNTLFLLVMLSCVVRHAFCFSAWSSKRSINKSLKNGEIITECCLCLRQTGFCLTSLSQNSIRRHPGLPGNPAQPGRPASHFPDTSVLPARLHRVWSRVRCSWCHLGENPFRFYFLFPATGTCFPVITASLLHIRRTLAARGLCQPGVCWSQSWHRGRTCGATTAKAKQRCASVQQEALPVKWLLAQGKNGSYSRLSRRLQTAMQQHGFGFILFFARC